MSRGYEDTTDDDDSGPATRRIIYLERSRHGHPKGDGSQRSRTHRSLSEDDGRSEVDRARKRLEHAVRAFTDTVRNTSRDVLLAAKSLRTCTYRWLDAERSRLVGPDGRGSAEPDGVDAASSEGEPSSPPSRVSRA